MTRKQIKLSIKVASVLLPDFVCMTSAWLVSPWLKFECVADYDAIGFLLVITDRNY